MRYTISCLSNVLELNPLLSNSHTDFRNDRGCVCDQSTGQSHASRCANLMPCLYLFHPYQKSLTHFYISFSSCSMVDGLRWTLKHFIVLTFIKLHPQKISGPGGSFVRNSMLFMYEQQNLDHEASKYLLYTTFFTTTRLLSFPSSVSLFDCFSGLLSDFYSASVCCERYEERQGSRMGVACWTLASYARSRLCE